MEFFLVLVKVFSCTGLILVILGKNLQVVNRGVA